MEKMQSKGCSINCKSETTRAQKVTIQNLKQKIKKYKDMELEIKQFTKKKIIYNY